MTANRNFKRRVRARAAKTGESYTAALRHLRSTPGREPVAERRRLLLAVTQSTLPSFGERPDDATSLATRGREVRELMRAAHRKGARVVHLPEGALCSPGPRAVADTDAEWEGSAPALDRDAWDWGALRHELVKTAALAGELGLWTVVGSVHRLTFPNRPHNSLYVFSDRGRAVTRYDERLLSATKLRYLYAPGALPVTFEVDGVRFGLLLGMEAHFPELFAEYERLNVDCVLYSSAGGGSGGTGVLANEVSAHAAATTRWVSLALPAGHAPEGAAGVAGPDGKWLVRGEADGTASCAVAPLDDGAAPLAEALTLARPWRRRVRDGLHEAYRVHGDPLSEDRTAF
ncbi:Predicted amidohydrolase [Streptomyces zhaozhouensis]|uniref:Predicted amidohydrolase n=1 Tax=Streptomyces zhaozhouensis TaxID=1300267 RepID=A0A286DT38_9ACTN|nr:carbon-nitrogen hydrolase family protein [Streptomyces zhaozhouensis]SOD61821.1 Predicted amidohydrolase [Streptomyces zhaozhouensis]